MPGLGEDAHGETEGLQLTEALQSPLPSHAPLKRSGSPAGHQHIPLGPHGRRQPRTPEHFQPLWAIVRPDGGRGGPPLPLATVQGRALSQLLKIPPRSGAPHQPAASAAALGCSNYMCVEQLSLATAKNNHPKLDTGNRTAAFHTPQQVEASQQPNLPMGASSGTPSQLTSPSPTAEQ